jgi:hypothetical protein
MPSSLTATAADYKLTTEISRLYRPLSTRQEMPSEKYFSNRTTLLA